MSIKDEYFSTSCFNTACWLRYKSVPIVSVENSGNKKVWLFAKNHFFDRAMAEWMNGEATVNLQSFLAIQKFIKSTLYQPNFN